MDRADVRQCRTKRIARALPAIGICHRAGGRYAVPAVYISAFVLSPIGTIGLPPSPRPAVPH